MRASPFAFPVCATALVALAAVVAILMSPSPLAAGDAGSLLRPSHIDPAAIPPVRFDGIDELAALESLQVGLSEVGDGGSYVWHRGHGRLSGVVTPTLSFKAADGRICRRFVVVMSSGLHSRRHESVACRLANGIWELGG
ncbi:MAG: hypothetical protein NW217_01535 [Hyphomicrobiaceae bacterium]|nr:hypothetical protein [Hyphomicrobiaceae bacterium]